MMADWTELPVPSTSLRLLHLNSDQLFAASTKSTEGIYKYNFIKKQWKLWTKYPENNDLQICPHFISSTFAINSASNKLFLLDDYLSFLQYQQLCIIDVDTKQYNTQNHQKKEPFCYHNSFGHWGMIHPSIINPNHLIIIPIMMVYDKEVKYPESQACNIHIPCHKNQSIIHIPSQNRLLAFGGHYAYYGTESVNGIWSCSLDTDNYKWERIGKLPKSQEDLQIVITSDERFIIIFGGVNGWANSMMELGDKIISDRIDDIYVLNLETMKLGISEIKSPLRTGEHRSGSIITNKTESSMLINGYCRNIVDIPIDVINTISLFCTMEYFHISDGESHFKIPLSEILNRTKKHKSIKL